MHEKILTNKQKVLLPLLKDFQSGFGLVGGTAIALQLGHRQSIDFDLFSLRSFENEKIRRILIEEGTIEKILRDEKDHYELIFNNVRLTFLYYPFQLTFTERFDDFIKMPNILTLAAMKAYALGRRAKWKDYVDLYFILQNYSLDEIGKRAKEIFGVEFNEKNFHVQLVYFKDIDYSEDVIFLPGFEVEKGLVQKTLVDLAAQ